MFAVRKYKPESDYAHLKRWWFEWDLPAAPRDFLPETAAIITYAGTPVCAGFLYQLGHTPMWWIEGIVTDKSLTPMDRADALPLLIERLTEMAKENQCELLMGSTPRATLAGKFQEAGFGLTPEKYFHLGKRI